MPLHLKRLLALCLLLNFCGLSYAEKAVIAVAANFKPTLLLLVKHFEHQFPQHQLSITSASTGALFNQINHGAPFDILLAADEATPTKLAELGKGVEASRFTYAEGQLVLASKTQPLIHLNATDIKVLLSAVRGKIAIANPRLAPYGLAAQQSLIYLDRWQQSQSRIVQANNISQVLQFLVSGNIELAFVPLAPSLTQHGLHFSPIPHDWYQPIRQQAILLQWGINNNAASDFLRFLKADAAAAIIRQQGYLIASRN